MSTPAPALAATPRPIVSVRLGDAANAATCMSVIFSLLLVVFPASFPNLIMQNWFNGHLTEGVLLFALLFNYALYVRIVRQRGAKADRLALLALGVATALTVIGFSFVLPAAVLMKHWREQAIVREEVLALVYFAVVAAVIIPFLIIRFTQDRKKKSA
jgi:hypothetical protein